MELFQSWIADKNSSEWLIYVKRLSGNDTGITGSHQVGVFLPKEVVSSVLPSLTTTSIKNPEMYISARVSSQGFPEQSIRGVYYNNKFHGGTRNEHRLTQWNTDVKKNPLQDGERTGALVFFAFNVKALGGDADYLDVWLCNDNHEEDYVEKYIGEIVPGNWAFGLGKDIFSGLAISPAVQETDAQIPDSWKTSFPTGEAIVAFMEQAFKLDRSSPDKLLMDKRRLEYRLFRQVEEVHVLEQVRDGFQTVDEFMQIANSVSNRRKSRSGRSLELHLASIFDEFQLGEFSSQCRTEGNKKPDFIFPSCTQYHNPDYPSDRLRMLAVKTTCKDRWRQILNEADRVEEIHLFTLQEGVSLNQFKEMQAEKVKLVVPEPLHDKYPKEIRGELMSLQQFISDTRNLAAELFAK